MSVSGKNAVPANVTPVDFVKKVLDHDLYAWQRQLFRLTDDVLRRSEELIALGEEPTFRITINKQRSSSSFALRARKLNLSIALLSGDSDGIT